MPRTKKKLRNNAFNQKCDSDNIKIDLTTAEQVSAFALQKVVAEYKNFNPEQKMDLIWSGANHLALRTKNKGQAIEDPTEIRVRVIQDKSLSQKQLGFSLLKSMFTIYTNENPKSKIQADNLSVKVEDSLFSIISDSLPSAGAKLYYSIGEICAGGNRHDYVKKYLPKNISLPKVSLSSKQKPKSQKKTTK